jgi:hypothetical protein
VSSRAFDYGLAVRGCYALLAAAVWAFFGPASAAAATDPWHEELARRWAPCIFQAVETGTANPLGRYDFFTRADFDGDTRGGDNWENADDKRKMEYPLLPYVYYSVIETRTHYYITYSIFHPRDWRWYLTAQAAGGGEPLPATHENDMESATFVILKDGGYGKLRLIGTVCHLQNYCFVNDVAIRPKPWAWDISSGEIQVTFFEGRPCLFLEAGGHGVGGVRRALGESETGTYTLGGKHYDFESGAGVLYVCSDDADYVPVAEPAIGGSAMTWDAAQDHVGRSVGAEAPGTSRATVSPVERDPGSECTVGAVCEYQLIPLLTTLWSLRQDVGGAGMFEDAFDYEMAPGLTLEDLAVYFAADGQDAGANPPWARDAIGDGLARGDWFFRPAEAMEDYLAQWPDRDMFGYDRYLVQPYAAGDSRVVVTSPDGGRTWTAGYPMRIEWDLSSSGPQLADQVKVFVSGNAGKTWRPVGASGSRAPDRAVWNVTGPAGDECIIAVRVGLGCDPDIEAVGYSPIISIREPEVFAWSMLDDGAGEAPATSFAQAVYDGDRDRLVLFGGRSGADMYRNDTWVFDFTGMAWRRVDDGLEAAPSARWGHTAVLDVRGRLVIHGGRGTEYCDDTWIFDFNTGLWHPLDTGGGDRAVGSAAVYDPSDDRMVVFGGWDGTALRNDVRALGLAPEAPPASGDEARLVPGRGHPAAPAGPGHWSTLHTGGVAAPPERMDAAGGYDAARRWFIIYGGRGGPMQDEPLADVWAFSLDSLEWNLLDDGSGYAPAARWGQAAAVDPRTGDLVIFGGTAGAASYNDTWLFDPDSMEWSQLDGGLAGLSPSRRSGVAAILRPLGSQLVVACGAGDACSEKDVWSMGLRAHTTPERTPAQSEDRQTNPEIAVWPNPSTGVASIGLAVPESGSLRVAVHDVRGRLVRLLNASRVRAGYHTFRWDGQSADGSAVASGVYFFAVTVNGRSYERPVVILR